MWENWDQELHWRYHSTNILVVTGDKYDMTLSILPTKWENKEILRINYQTWLDGGSPVQTSPVMIAGPCLMRRNLYFQQLQNWLQTES